MVVSEAGKGGGGGTLEVVGGVLRHDRGVRDRQVTSHVLPLSHRKGQ